MSGVQKIMLPVICTPDKFRCKWEYNIHKSFTFCQDSKLIFQDVY